MVELYKGEGQPIEQLAKKVSVDLVGLRKIVIIGSEANREANLVNFRLDLLESLSKYPQFDMRSVLFEDVLDGQTQGDFLFVPDDCPTLSPILESTRELPEEGETFIAKVWKSGRKKEGIRLFVLEDDLALARRRSLGQAAKILKCDWESLRVSVDAVSIEEFMKQIKQRIDAGGRIPLFLMRFRRVQQLLAERETGRLST